MTTTQMQSSLCLSCGEVLDAATSVFEDATPSDGDVTVCFKCGHIMVFDGGGRLRNPNDQEMKDIAGDQRIIKMQRARATVQAQRQKP